MAGYNLASGRFCTSIFKEKQKNNEGCGEIEAFKSDLQFEMMYKKPTKLRRCFNTTHQAASANIC